MGQPPLGRCGLCRHLREGLVNVSDDEAANPTAQYACDAFPKGIPDEITEDGFDHRLAYLGDGGIRFEPRA